MTPASTPRWRIAKASTGVGNGRGSTMARRPAPIITAQVSRANWSDLCRASYPTTTLDPPCARRYAASPAAARMTTARFIRFEPAPRVPRRPAVPNSSLPENRSSRSAMAASSADSARSMSSVSSGRVSGSGSSASQARAVSSTSVIWATSAVVSYRRRRPKVGKIAADMHSVEAVVIGLGYGHDLIGVNVGVVLGVVTQRHPWPRSHQPLVLAEIP